MPEREKNSAKNCYHKSEQNSAIEKNKRILNAQK
jgi:hypothetical protein